MTTQARALYVQMQCEQEDILAHIEELLASAGGAPDPASSEAMAE